MIEILWGSRSKPQIINKVMFFGIVAFIISKYYKNETEIHSNIFVDTVCVMSSGHHNP